jgi:hypothetical protein
MNRRRTVTAVITMVALLAITGIPASVAWAHPPEKETLEFSWDLPFWECDGFTVYEKADIRLVTMKFYDRDGNPTRRVEHWSLDGGLYRYPDETSFLSYVPAHEKGIFNESGELTAVVGLFVKVIIPGEGPIFHDVGRVEFDPDWNLTLSAGRHDYWDGNGDALCAALEP